MEQELSEKSTREPGMQVDDDDNFCSCLLKGCLWFGGAVQTIACLPCWPCGGGGVSFKIEEGYRAAVLHYGKLKQIVGPGTYYANPCTTQFKVVSIQVITLDVPQQLLMTKDNVSLRINTVIYYQITDVKKALFNVRDFNSATSNFAQSTLRTVIGEHNLDEIFSNRAQINARLTHIIDVETELWGIKVTNVEIKDIQIPPEMERMLASVAEAKREGAAKVITAEAELKAATTLAEAADVLATNPMSLQLRYFQTLTEISADKSSTIIVPSEIITGGRSNAPEVDLEKILKMRKVLKAEREERLLAEKAKDK